MQFVRSKQTNTIYAVTPYTVTAMTSAKVWQDTVKAFGLSEEYTVSLDDGDIAAIAADCAARRQLLVVDIVAALKEGE